MEKDERKSLKEKEKKILYQLETCKSYCIPSEEEEYKEELRKELIKVRARLKRLS